jgi:hypothetical protein
MKSLFFTIDINASKEIVWNVLWDDTTYRQWTSVFSEGSYCISDWKQGDKIIFLNADKNGMFSVIEKKHTPEFMSFKHIGVVKNGEEQPLDAEAQKWTGATENYTLSDSGDGTQLTVEITVTDDFTAYFNESFPKALQKVKDLAEKVKVS